VALFSDSQRGHTGGGYAGGHYRISDNGKQVTHGRLKDNSEKATSPPVPG